MITFEEILKEKIELQEYLRSLELDVPSNDEFERIFRDGFWTCYDLLVTSGLINKNAIKNGKESNDQY